MDDYKVHRTFLKDTLRKSINFRQSAQHRGRPEPPLEKPTPDDALRITLPDKKSWQVDIPQSDVVENLASRKSRRNFNENSLSIQELSFLLCATQGLRKSHGNTPQYRNVPSAGARHSFETYLFIHRVENIPKGLYRYLPLTHELALLYEEHQTLKTEISSAVFGQNFVANSAVTFVWATVPERMEWRYLEAAHRVILLDAGHVCQNLYLACENIGSGTCAIAAYDQEKMDNLLGINGESEFTVYLAPVGRY